MRLVVLRHLCLSETNCVYSLIKFWLFIVVLCYFFFYSPVTYKKSVHSFFDDDRFTQYMAHNSVLSDEKRKEFDESYRASWDKLPICPTCQSKTYVIPSVRGRPTHDLSLYADESHVKLSDCTQGYQGWCKKCEKFL